MPVAARVALILLVAAGGALGAPPAAAATTTTAKTTKAKAKAKAPARGTGDDATGAAVLADIDDAFALLVRDDDRTHAAARRRLARAARSFDDLRVGDDVLRQALVGDANKPWRGRAYERVLSLVTLAALDVERGRCDLALPTLRNAALHDARVAPAAHRGDSDAVVVFALALRCLADGDESVGGAAAAADVARARDDLRRAVAAAGGGDDDDAVRAVERRVRDPGARLVFTGWGPAFARAGVHGERLELQPRDEDDGIAAVARLGSGAPRGDAGLHEAWAAQATLAWSSTTQATAVRGRPFDSVRAARARDKDAAAAAGQAALAAAWAAPPTGWTTTTLVGRGVQATGGAGLLVVGAALDARADDRFVAALPGRVWIVAP
ncbi:MAG: hypothetical protein FJ137_06350 [Deltaproteobacteria bacterium]|nr:hypothetical protein [Deltaproteobacteria bacterium]